MKRRKVKSQKEMSGPVITMPVLFFRPSMATADLQQPVQLAAVVGR